MQESVTILNFKKWPKPRKMLAILLAAIFLFILIIGVIIALSVNSKNIILLTKNSSTFIMLT